MSTASGYLVRAMYKGERFPRAEALFVVGESCTLTDEVARERARTIARCCVAMYARAVRITRVSGPQLVEARRDVLRQEQVDEEIAERTAAGEYDDAPGAALAERNRMMAL